MEQLQAAREHDLLPYFRLLEGPAGPTVAMEGAERIMLGGNNYLGLTGHPDVVAGAHDALGRYGTGVTGSRFMNGTLPLHLELERELADWCHTEDALVFTAGYLANTGSIATLLGPGDTVICDSGDHASILDAVAMSRARVRPFRHGRLDKLEKMLVRAQDDGGGLLVVVDGVFSMEGDLADVPEIARLCKQHGARLMVDEAHGVGVLGERGTGATELLGAEADVDLRMGTFSKSLASCGGFIAGPVDVIDFLRVQSRSFMFTASAVPAAVGAALGALRVIRSPEGADLMARVLDNGTHLRRGLQKRGFEVPDGISPIIPVVIGDDWKAALMWKALYEAGVYVNVALYPAVPRGGALLRTSVSAAHTREHLDTALARFEAAREDLPTMPEPVAS
ncbi:MAG: aminotransferase class I/II-fold pyridoxal phosphate-dependent enzyme [Actinomycetota bacterium]|nr:aminotransferase class I/II-fold pyridoxal phosphate-dependent enzyme [Actinomycetota bacterium]